MNPRKAPVMIDLDAMEARAWKASDGEHAEIVYAGTRNRARQIGSGRLDCEYVEVTATRAPQFDGYAPHGPTDQDLFAEFGWWFECHTCTGSAHKDSGGQLVNGEITCASCIERTALSKTAPFLKGGA